MYCKVCGASYSGSSGYCPSCGSALDSTGSSGTYDVVLPNMTTRWLASRVQTNAVIWLFIALYQIIVGIPLAVVGYGVAMVFCGIWNIVMCNKDFAFAKRIRACNNVDTARSIVSTIDQSKTSTIIALFVNLFLGGLLGVIGCIFWLILRSKVLDRAPEMGVSY